MSGEGYIPGTWYVLCDACQRKVRSSKVAYRWDGLLVHADPNEGCWETRHEQEFVRAVPDNKPLPFVRPDNEGIEATLVFDCTSEGFIYVDRSLFAEDLVTNVYNWRVVGPVEVAGTVNIVCTLEVVFQ